MREFADIQIELGLEKYLNSPLGTLYCGPASQVTPTVMVRHFDRGFQFAGPFADLVLATRQWILDRWALAQLVDIERPIEVGHDFVTRPFHVYCTSTSAYIDWDDPTEIPEELAEMREAFRAACGTLPDRMDTIIEMVLTRTLLEPAGKTYFNELTGKFIVVEPTLTLEDVQRWAALAVG